MGMTCEFSTVNRVLAALLLLVWTTSVGRCLAEQYGLLHEMPGLECCEHDHDHGIDHADEVPGPPSPAHSHSESDPCGICHMIEHTGVNLVRPVVLAAALYLPVADLVLPELDWMPAADAAGLNEALIRPPIRLCWGAYLVNTSLPVRGPNLA
jgi:hypothetical protein